MHLIFILKAEVKYEHYTATLLLLFLLKSPAAAAQTLRQTIESMAKGFCVRRGGERGERVEERKEIRRHSENCHEIFPDSLEEGHRD